MFAHNFFMTFSNRFANGFLLQAKVLTGLKVIDLKHPIGLLTFQPNQQIVFPIN